MPNWTVKSILDSARPHLAKAGSASSRLDSDLLLCFLLGLDRLQLYTQADRPVSDAEREAYRELVRRRSRGEPLAYILGRRAFWKLDLQVDGRVLIPRPETELLVELAIAFVGERRRYPWRIVDVGTGSGAIALALASELPSAQVVAIDASPDALAVAAANADRAGLRERVRLVRGDLLAPILAKSARVDLVVSNPPYIGEVEGPDLPRDVRDWEPAAALFSGPDGLDAIRRLIPAAARCLRPGGLLLLEHGARQGAVCRGLASDPFAAVTTARDLSGHERALRAQLAGEWLPET